MNPHSTPRPDKQPADSIGFVFIGPSGAGKSTLRNELCKQQIDGHGFVAFRPVTSRPRRPGEDEYVFVNDNEFDELLKSDDIIFSNESYGNRFLTPWPAKLSDASRHYIYIYLPAAAEKLRGVFANTKIIQIVPDDLSVIENRIRGRDPDITKSELKRRLASAEAEISDGQKIANIVFVNKYSVAQSTQLLIQELRPLLY